MTENNKPNAPKEEVFVIPPSLQVFDDPRTHAKTLALPFQFPDGTSGILMVSRLHRMGWKPADYFEKITITYKE